MGNSENKFYALIRRRTLPDGNPIRRFSDGFPGPRPGFSIPVVTRPKALVVLEAAAKGVPAIVSDGCAARDLIVHETGLFFRNGDIADLAEKISALQDPKLAEDLGRRAYERY